MQIDYDPQADAMYIRQRPREVSNTIEAGKYIYVDVVGVPLGIEILFAGRLNTQNDLTSVPVNIGHSSPVADAILAAT